MPSRRGFIFEYFLTGSSNLQIFEDLPSFDLWFFGEFRRIQTKSDEISQAQKETKKQSPVRFSEVNSNSAEFGHYLPYGPKAKVNNFG
jgi:hypothetical protein